MTVKILNRFGDIVGQTDVETAFAIYAFLDELGMALSLEKYGKAIGYSSVDGYPYQLIEETKE
jgi:hypothetical protein